MRTYKLKSIARRGSMFVAVAGLIAATLAPSIAFADALNPLTERSLLLSSSAPGFQDTDGSGNSTANPNAAADPPTVPGTYAPAGSGANGMKTGETFSFRVSTDSTDREIKAFTLQYCTTAAGKCQAPGNNTGDGRLVDITDEDFDPEDEDTWVSRASTRQSNADAKQNNRADLDVNYTDAVAGTDFQIFMGEPGNETEVSTGWELATSNVEDLTYAAAGGNDGSLTGKKNFITLTSETGIAPTSNTLIRIVFKASETNYITNPGSGAFFVKMNTYDTDDTDEHIPAVSAENNEHIIDGGVTVANVMTDSIHITTKVLETMAFSVGTRNRDTVKINVNGEPGYEGGSAVHGTCDPIQTVNGNRLQLGNPNAEYSLETGRTWDVYSYWRLSSNSSGGATVYYSGNTLANTVGDEIAEIGETASASTQGTEQFGLGFVDATSNDQGKFHQDFIDLVGSQPLRYKMPGLISDNLLPSADYANGDGKINPDGTETGTATFAFVKSSNSVPAVIATNSTSVISCATAKMRYIANIGADTPAGVYTTKINYLAAPQY